MKILGKRILIETRRPVKTDGGIFLPETGTASNENSEGVVMAIGSAIKESLPYTKGSFVFVAMYSGMKVQVMGKERLLVEQDDICGVMVGNAFHPVGDRILLKPIKTVAPNSKIVRPSAYEDDKDDLITCTVHLLGVGIKNKKGALHPFSIKVGDSVMIKPFCGRDVDTATGTFKLIKQESIEAIINESNL